MNPKEAMKTENRTAAADQSQTLVRNLSNLQKSRRHIFSSAQVLRIERKNRRCRISAASLFDRVKLLLKLKNSIYR
jgi:thymidylate synthase